MCISRSVSAPPAYRPQMSLSEQQEVFVFIGGLLDVTAGHRDKTLSFLYLSLFLPLA